MAAAATTTAAAVATATAAEAQMPNYEQLTVWTADDFASFYSNDQKFELYTKQVEMLKVQVKDELVKDTTTTDEAVEKVKLIDLLYRLGVSYHFGVEIEDQLDQIFNSQPNIFHEHNDYDLYNVALIFRVFRQYGYKVSSDMFNKFKESDGKFKSETASDVKGLLSLYEATHLSIHGEESLDEDRIYSIDCLKSMANQCSPYFSKRIALALEQAFHRNIPRLESRRSISLYEEDESHDQNLLNLAKTDFNRVQLLHQQELGEFSRWYRDLELASKFPYARHRIPEVYLWTIGGYFEPQYSRARIILAKITAITAIVDDAYGAYGTVEQLHKLTDAIERWEIDAANDLPDNMKSLYTILLNVYEELEAELEKDGRSYVLQYSKETVKQVARSYIREAEWVEQNVVPQFDEFIENAFISTAYRVVTVGSLVGLGEVAGKEEFEWIQTIPKIDRAVLIIARYMDTIAASKAEHKRICSKGTEYYMKEHGVTMEEANECFQKRIEDAWKDINEEVMKPVKMPIEILMRLFNLIRVMDVMYKHEDTFTNPEGLKDYIKSLFIDPIPL